MSDRCAKEMFLNTDPCCILNAGHAGDCQSTEVALAKMLEEMIDAIESGEIVSIEFTDRARSFLARARGTR